MSAHHVGRARLDLSALISGAAVLAGLFFVAMTAMAADDSPPAADVDHPAGVQQVARDARESVVVITVSGRDGKQEGLGTGFVVSDDGLIATNLHVIGEARPISVQTADGQMLRATAVHAWDRAQDLAVLRVDPGELSLLIPLGDADGMPEGEAVVVMGNPHGLKHSVVSGVISGRREIDGRQMLQLAIPIEPGNSGGPVLDMQGRALGVVTMKSAITENLGFAGEIAALRALLAKPNPVPIERWLTIGIIDPREWTPRFGANWKQRAGRILVDGVGQGFGGRSLCLSTREVPSLPFEIAVMVRLDEESGAAGLVFHADGEDRHYGFYPSNGRLRLSCFRGPSVFSWQVLREVASEHYQPGEWNELKVRVEKDKFLCFVNQHLVIEAADKTLTEGKVGLAKFRQTAAEFKKFRVGPEIPSTTLEPEAAARFDELINQLPALEALRDQQLEPLSNVTGVSVLEARAEQLEQQAQALRHVASEAHIRNVVSRLGKLVSENPESFGLLEAALLIAQLDDREVDIAGYLHEVERMAAEIRDSLPRDASEDQLLQRLNAYLFQENGFHGSRFDYYHRANSYLNRVIDDREGLPITLSVLYIELGKRLGLRIEGVGLPAHFVVRHVPKSGDSQLIDVYEGGEPLSREDAAARVRELTGGPLLDEYLNASTPREIVIRMLRNLLGLAESAGDKAGMLRYVEAMVEVEPESIQHRGMRAVLGFETGRRDAALADLDWIIEQAPEDVDLDRIRQMQQIFLRTRPGS